MCRNIVNSYRLVYLVFSAVVAVGAFVLVSLPAHPPNILADNASHGSRSDMIEEHDSDTEAAEPSPLDSLEGPSAVAELTFTEEIGMDLYDIEAIICRNANIGSTFI